VDKIVEAAREASVSAGAAVFTKDFLEESDTLKTNVAKPWLNATVALGKIPECKLFLRNLSWNP
jgi:hypothetical protein